MRPGFVWRSDDCLIPMLTVQGKILAAVLAAVLAAGGYLFYVNDKEDTRQAESPILSQDMNEETSVEPEQKDQSPDQPQAASAESKKLTSPTTNSSSPVDSQLQAEPAPASEPEPEPESPSAPEPEQTPPAAKILNLSVTADESAATPPQFKVARGTTVNLTFNVKNEGVYYGGIDFRSSVISTGTIYAGQSKTITFSANQSFNFLSYWPASNVQKNATVKILVE